MRGRSTAGSIALGTIIMFVAILALIVTFPTSALAQQPAPDAPAPQREVTELRDRVNDLSNRIDFSLAFFGLIIVVGGGLSLYGFFKEESRTERAFKLFAAGETAAQNRATQIHETFLIPSKETLELVKATLEISKTESDRRAEESDRREKSIEVRVKATLRELDRHAKLLISKISEEDIHELASNPTRRAEVGRLARRIDSFETNRLIFQETPELTPHILFVRGMDFHLSQNFDGSLDAWEKVVVDSESPEELKRLAWYWIGREQNNLARFDEAERSFTNAKRNASRVLSLELQRNILESKFFNKDRRAADLIGPLERLLEETTYERDIDGTRMNRVRANVLTTLGNVRIEAGDECDDPDEKEEHYRQALDIFEQAAGQDKWALFGKVEALYCLKRCSEAYPIYRDELRPQAIYEYQRRVEPRAKTVARMLEFICCVRVPDLWNEVPRARENVIESLDEVDDHLTVYSEIWHRNASKSEFRSHIDQLMREWEELRKQPLIA
jgi:tetratricopeptide (TPR) repeat protein